MMADVSEEAAAQEDERQCSVRFVVRSFWDLVCKHLWPKKKKKKKDLTDKVQRDSVLIIPKINTEVLPLNMLDYRAEPSKVQFGQPGVSRELKVSNNYFCILI